MSNNTCAVAKSVNSKRRIRNLLGFQFTGIFYLLLTCSLPCLSNTVKEETANVSMSASYTTINEHGKSSFCTISSKDSIEKLEALKNTDCKLSGSDDHNDPSVILISHSPYHETKQVLLTTRNLLMWAYLAVHAYKVWDSGSKLLWPPVCPCSGQPKIVTNTQIFFFTYYVASMLHHGWSYFSPYFFWSEQKTNKDLNDKSDRFNLSSKDREEGWTETLTNIMAMLAEHPYANHILSLALDSAALKWDCRCAGYFSDANGGFYFNGHLWMLLLNVAIFATDLAIDYL
ncbi:hypothetical protein [Endozoicomonas sp. SCSIO W0465]|uniref:hypothetical protein n=1 Tax=Endozoicomonas sp. SCSIO W0465 TaxID=2918516 RepID=UPI0020765FF2|nr:hypothetical protein [Endozoicomonas sp. SCSIO W0465]USE37915.1 hypothetical protein MJO57_06915 [Endozoicomonas sp. SCSIO W0465]